MSQLQKETFNQRNAWLERDRIRHEQVRAAETTKQRESRLEQNRIRQTQTRAVETPEQRHSRLERDRNCHAQPRAAESESLKTFENAINTFCERCTKQCYPNQIQRVVYNPAVEYLPLDLSEKEVLLLCSRCRKHVTSNKTIGPRTGIIWNQVQFLM